MIFFRKTVVSVCRLLSAIALLTAFSCSSDDTTHAISVKIQVVLPDGFNSSASYAGREVKLTKGSQVLTAVTDESGIALFINLVPDVYDISTSWEIDGDEYVTMIEGDAENKAVVLSGSLLQKAFITDGEVITLQTEMATKQGLLISKVYYAGCKDNNNKNYSADQYIEFYNNSDESMYVDGLYFALAESESTPAYPASSNSGYVYAKQIFQFPGSGTEYKLEPGASVLVVNSATDHTQSASASIDLTNATFEAKGSKFANNPAVPQLILKYTTYASLPYMNLLAGGDLAVVLFSTKDDVDSWEKVYKVGATSGNMFVKIPSTTIMDGIECLKNKATTGPEVTAKRLYNFIDAGYQFINSVSGYTGEVVCRIKSSVTNGNAYLKDTNNSTDDFSVLTGIKPGLY